MQEHEDRYVSAVKRYRHDCASTFTLMNWRKKPSRYLIRGCDQFLWTQQKLDYIRYSSNT